MDDLVKWLTDANYAGHMQHMRDGLEIDLRHAQAAEALATRDARIAELTERNEGLEHLFDIQWARTREAGELWRQAHPGNELVSPDLGELVKWLMDRATAAETRLREAERIMQPLAEAAYSYDPDEDDSNDIAWAHDFKIGTLRAARAFIEKETADAAS